MEIEQTIIAWLEAHSVALSLQHVPGRAAFLAHAGLHELQNAIHLEGSALVFCGNLLGVLASYGALADGRDPVVALFDAAKTMVGADKRAECDALIAQWRQRPPEERRPRPADAPRHPSQTFASGGGAMNSAQDHAVANQYNTYNGVSPELFAEYVKKLALTEEIVQRFFTILEQRQTPRDEWDRKLQEIAAQYKELLQRLEFVQSEDPRVLELKAQARQAIEAGRFDEAETRLKQAEARDLRAIEQLEAAAQKRRISAAETNADNARLQRLQLRYAHAADYWRQAAKLLPEGEKQKRAFYLIAAGNDFDRIARYADALLLFEQSLAIYQEIGDQEGEGVARNNIGNIYRVRGDYDTALRYFEQSLVICREIGNKEGEGATLNNLSQIYDVRGDYATALTYLEQSLAIQRKIGDRDGEGTTLNNLSQIYDALGDYATALTYLEQSLAIRREIGDKAGEGTTLSNIGAIYHAQSEYATALTYLEQSLAISREIGDKAGEATRLNNIALIFKARDDYATALANYEKSLAISREIGNKESEATTLNNLSQIYDMQGNYAKAFMYLTESLAIHLELGNRAMQGTTLHNLGMLYRETGQIDEARRYLQDALTIFEEIGSPTADDTRQELEMLTLVEKFKTFFRELTL